MPEYDLKLTLKKMGAKRMHFALYRGSEDDQILVTPRPATVKLISEMEEECGETKRIARGQTFYEDNVLIFATEKDPSPQWEKEIKQVLKKRRYANYKNIEMRKLADDELAEDGE